jgi:hypothetical protein
MKAILTDFEMRKSYHPDDVRTTKTGTERPTSRTAVTGA